jgi:hypothetical protein
MIESQLGYKLDWQELLDKKASRVIITKVADFRDESQQEDIIQWSVERSDEFTKVFKKLL